MIDRYEGPDRRIQERRGLNEDYSEAVGRYNKDRLIQWISVAVGVLVVVGSFTTMVLVTIRVQDQHIQNLSEADREIKASYMKEIYALEDVVDEKIQDMKKEIMLARKYQKENREKISICQSSISNIMGILEVSSTAPKVPAMDLFHADKFGHLERRKVKTQ